MSIVYEDNPGKPDFVVPLHRQNATKAYLRHYENLLLLTFIANNERATAQERRQAQHELKICERKLEYWKKYPNYVHGDVLEGTNKLKKQWSNT